MLASIATGVNVIQSDLESAASRASTTASFDCVILSQTLQAMRHIETIIVEMLRVGREAIVSFPNFGHWIAPAADPARAHAGVGRACRTSGTTRRTSTSARSPTSTRSSPSAASPCSTASCSPAAARSHVLPNLRGELAIYRFRRHDAPPRARPAGARA